MNSNLPEPCDSVHADSGSTADVLATCTWCGAVVAYHEPGVVNLDQALVEHLAECVNGVAARAAVAARDTPLYGPEGWPLDLLPVEVVTLDLGPAPAPPAPDVIDLESEPARLREAAAAARASLALRVLPPEQADQLRALIDEYASRVWDNASAWARGDDQDYGSAMSPRSRAYVALSGWISDHTDYRAAE